MTDRIDYCETPEFQKDFKKLLKKFKTLEGDFELAKRATIELYHIQKINNLSVFPMPGFYKEPIQIMKLKKFACKSLGGRGAKSGIRIIYAINSLSYKVDFIEILRGAVNMLHNPYCSPSTSRAAKTSGVNYIPPSLVYFKGDQENEDRERIKAYLKNCT